MTKEKARSVLQALVTHYNAFSEESAAICKAIEVLEATPGTKKEHWIDGGKIGLGMGAHDYICSGCHWHKSDFPEIISESRYCQSCGAQMETETPPLSPLGEWLNERAEHDPFYENLRPRQEDA